MTIEDKDEEERGLVRWRKWSCPLRYRNGQTNSLEFHLCLLGFSLLLLLLLSTIAEKQRTVVRERGCCCL